MAEVKDGLPSTDFSRMNREYIKAVAEDAAGGGGLPEITESDEGKVLTVENGEAAWKSGGGGGGGGENNIFYIEIANIDAVNSTFTISTNAEEMTAAFEAGKQCFAHHNSFYWPVNGYEVDEGYIGWYASEVSYSEGDLSYRYLSYENEDGDVTAVYHGGSKAW